MSVIEIPLTQGKVAIVDAEDAQLVQRYQWHACYRQTTWYAATSAERRKGRAIYLHRYIANAQPGEHVDHINGDGLDCRRANLRICTNAENRRNTRKTRGVSQYKGVSRCKTNATRVWEAYIWFENRKIGLGTYCTEDDAARAYNAAALQYHGRFAKLNIISGITHEESIMAPVRNRMVGRPRQQLCAGPIAAAG
jgi:hypothetical protein